MDKFTGFFNNQIKKAKIEYIKLSRSNKANERANQSGEVSNLENYINKAIEYEKKINYLPITDQSKSNILQNLKKVISNLLKAHNSLFILQADDSIDDSQKELYLAELANKEHQILYNICSHKIFASVSIAIEESIATLDPSLFGKFISLVELVLVTIAPLRGKTVNAYDFNHLCALLKDNIELFKEKEKTFINPFFDCYYRIQNSTLAISKVIVPTSDFVIMSHKSLKNYLKLYQTTGSFNSKTENEISQALTTAQNLLNNLNQLWDDFMKNWSAFSVRTEENSLIWHDSKSMSDFKQRIVSKTKNSISSFIDPNLHSILSKKYRELNAIALAFVQNFENSKAGDLSLKLIEIQKLLVKIIDDAKKLSL